MLFDACPAALQGPERPMTDILPLDTLQNVKDLTLKLCHIGHEPQWPEPWNQLTSISRLELNTQLNKFERLRALSPSGSEA